MSLYIWPLINSDSGRSVLGIFETTVVPIKAACAFVGLNDIVHSSQNFQAQDPFFKHSMVAL